MALFDENFFGVTADGKITLCTGLDDCCPTVSVNGTPIVPTTIDGQPNYDVVLASGGDTSVVVDLNNNTNVQTIASHDDGTGTVVNIEETITTWTVTDNGDDTTTTEYTSEDGTVTNNTACNKNIKLLRDEDGRETTKASCQELLPHRTIHVTGSLHAGSVGPDDIMVSHADSDQTAINGVTTNHDKTVISATNATTTGNNSLVSGDTNNNTGNNSFVSGFDNINTGATSIVSGRDNTNNQRDSLVVGRGNTVTTGGNPNNTSFIGSIVGGLNNNVGTSGRNLVVGANNNVVSQNNVVGGAANQVIQRNNIVGGSGNVLSPQDYLGYSLVVGVDNLLQNDAGSSMVSGENNVLDNAKLNSLTGQNNSITNGNENDVSGNNNTLLNTFRNVVGGSLINIDNTANPNNGDSILVGQSLTNNGFLQVAVFNEGITARENNQTHVGKLRIDIDGQDLGSNARIFATAAGGFAATTYGEVYGVGAAGGPVQLFINA